MMEYGPIARVVEAYKNAVGRQTMCSLADHAPGKWIDRKPGPAPRIFWRARHFS